MSKAIAVAATVIERFLDANHPCACTPDDYCPGNADEAYALAEAALLAATPHVEAAAQEYAKWCDVEDSEMPGRG